MKGYTEHEIWDLEKDYEARRKILQFLEKVYITDSFEHVGGLEGIIKKIKNRQWNIL